MNEEQIRDEARKAANRSQFMSNHIYDHKSYEDGFYEGMNKALRQYGVIGSASSNFKIMWSLKPTNKKPIEVKQIVFDNVAGIFDYPKNIRIPNVGEYVWFSIWKQGTVLSVENKLEDGFL